MKFLLIAILLSACGEHSQAPQASGKNEQRVETLNLLSLSGKSLFDLAAYLDNTLSGQSKLKKEKTIQALDEKFFIQCKKLTCTITSKD